MRLEDQFEKESLSARRFTVRNMLRLLALTLLGGLAIACSSSEEPPSVSETDNGTPEIQRFIPPDARVQLELPRGADTSWHSRSGTWPKQIVGKADSLGVFVFNGLAFRFDLNLGQNFNDSLFPGGHPLLALLSVTVVPVLDFKHVEDFRLDTIYVRNPLTQNVLPPLVLIATERELDNRQLFVRMSTKVIDLYEPEPLVEDQLLVPWVEFTLADRRWKVELPAEHLAFVSRPD